MALALSHPDRRLSQMITDFTRGTACEVPSAAAVLAAQVEEGSGVADSRRAADYCSR